MIRRRIALIWLILWSIAIAFPGNPGWDLGRTLEEPSRAHLFGLDTFGRDVWALTLLGARNSVLLTLLTVAGTLILSIGLGAFIALLPSLPQRLGLRALDFWLAMPSLILALTWAALFGPGWGTLIFSLLVGSCPSLTRFFFTQIRSLMAEPYFEAARALGANHWRIATHHLWPGLRNVTWVKIPHLFAQVLLAEATLSFLGVGAPIGQPSWGSALAKAQDNLLEAPYILLGAALPLILTLLSLIALAPSSGVDTSNAKK